MEPPPLLLDPPCHGAARSAIDPPALSSPFFSGPAMRFATAFSVLLLGNVLAGCAGTGMQPSRGSSPARTCSMTTPDSTDVPITSLMPPQTAAERLAADGKLRAAAPDTGLVSVAYDSTGALGEVRYFRRQMISEEDARAIARHLRDYFPARGAPRANGWGLLVRDQSPRLLDYQPRGECMPAIANRGELARLLQRAADDRALRGRSAVVRVRVGRDGSVMAARVHGSSGSVTADQALLGIARHARFVPATLDGFVVPVWSSFPLSIVAP